MMPNPNPEENVKVEKITGDCADLIAGILKGCAGWHYGRYYTPANTNEVFSDPQRRPFKRPTTYATSEAERARLAKTAFTWSGVTFSSYEEVEAVARLFRERFGEKEYRAPEEITVDLTTVLNDVRAQAKKPKLHDQGWRDNQPVPDPESSVKKFRKALKRAEKKKK